MNESRQKIEVKLQDAPRGESVETVSVVNEPQKNDMLGICPRGNHV